MQHTHTDACMRMLWQQVQVHDATLAEALQHLAQQMGCDGHRRRLGRGMAGRGGGKGQPNELYVAVSIIVII